MKIAILGAGGFIGKAITGNLEEKHDIIVFTRRKEKQISGTKIHHCVYSGLEELTELLRQTPFEALINLAGEPIAGRRWTSRQKEIIRNSRVETTRAVVDAVRGKSGKPDVMISASAVGYYGNTGNRLVNESAPPSDDFLGQVCKDWEWEARNAETAVIRVVCLRLGVVLGPGGGALTKILPIFRWYAGGPVGSGRQWMSWIHIRDVVRIVEFAISFQGLRGPVNAVSPEPVTMKEFTGMLGKIMHRPSFIRIPDWVLKSVYGESASLLTASQKVKPQKLTDFHFSFSFPSMENTLSDIIGNK